MNNDPTGHEICDEWGNCFDRNKMTTTPPTYVFLICGWDSEGQCAGPASQLTNMFSNPPVSANVVVYDFDDYNDQSNGKFDTAAAILEIMHNESNPFAQFYLIGHSAGVDIALLVGESSGDSRISGIALLDPSLSAGTEFPNWGDLRELVDIVLGKGINVFAGFGTVYDNWADDDPNVIDYPDEFLDVDEMPYQTNWLGTELTIDLSGYENYSYNRYDIGHLGMSISNKVANDVWNFFLGKWG